MVILPKIIYKFSSIANKIPMILFAELEQIILNVYRITQNTEIAKAILRKQEQSWRYNTSKLHTVLQSYSNRDSVVLVPRHTDQGNRIENPEINPDTYGQLISDKGGKKIKWGKRQSFQQVLLGNLDSCM